MHGGGKVFGCRAALSASPPSYEELVRSLVKEAMCGDRGCSRELWRSTRRELTTLKTASA
jgi:hypothetical protein